MGALRTKSWGFREELMVADGAGGRASENYEQERLCNVGVPLTGEGGVRNEDSSFRIASTVKL